MRLLYWVAPINKIVLICENLCLLSSFDLDCKFLHSLSPSTKAPENKALNTNEIIATTLVILFNKVKSLKNTEMRRATTTIPISSLTIPPY